MRKIKNITDILINLESIRKKDSKIPLSKEKYRSISPDELGITKYHGTCYDYAEYFAKMAITNLGYHVYKNIELENKSLALFMFRLYDSNWAYARKKHGHSTYYSHVWVQIRDGVNSINQIEQFPVEDVKGKLYTCGRYYSTYEESLDELFKKYKNFVFRKYAKEDDMKEGNLYYQLFQYKPFFLKNRFGLTQSQLLREITRRGTLVREEGIL